MASTTSDAADSFERTIIDTSQRLIEAFRDNDQASVVREARTLNAARDRAVFLELGRLTRGIHEALSNLSSGNPNDDLLGPSAEGDPSDNLNRVIELTATAAHRTMDLVEAALPQTNMLLRGIEDLRDHVKDDPGALAILDANDAATRALAGNLKEILVAQDYQDLSGQLIRQVVSILVDAETRLVDLVLMASSLEEMAGLPQFQSESEEAEPAPAARVANQQEVDDLLSSLGF